MEGGPIVRDADRDDVMAVCRFGEEHVRAWWAPLIGEEEAARRVRMWWNATDIAGAVARGAVVVAEDGGCLSGVGQHDFDGGEHVIRKLSALPRYRGLGLRLLEVLIGRLPVDVERVYAEHLVADERAGAFFEREGFTVERAGPSADPRLGVVRRSRDR
ncbi:GNAT family N-acetyltransferase [Amycolatopsis sp. EV170708-02-1]|uniref:GNAT family N-acetyltransferase n=1 Tax=Amycolatopsis sp. EV170708-02-1 TaxID=2919322 RepID=UPI001F0B844F|nr:GNAT family N-acetyltransferase [Amycolatopsis sp. EV170708-02-1]UMP06298.1 GNAT family N-acetyltransferase [Amycolatopsis sp. EV170708-02-1]